MKGVLSSVCAVIPAAGYSTRMGGDPKALLPLGASTMLGLAVQALAGAGIRRIRVATGHESDRVGEEALEHKAIPVYNNDFAQGMFSSLCAGLADIVQEEEDGGDPVAAVFLLPVDAALVRPQSVAARLRVWLALAPEARGKAVLLPAFAGRPGHPLLLGAEHLQPILDWQGKGQWQGQLQWRGGLHDYLGFLLQADAAATFSRGGVPQGRENPAELFAGAEDPLLPKVIGAPSKTSATVLFLPLPDVGVLSDIDSPADYEEARSLLARSNNRTRPLPGEAWEWLRHSSLSREKIRHSLKVALSALRLARALERSGRDVDLELTVCGGLLHDISRIRKDHARLGRDMTLAQGWPECALVVGAHTVLPDAQLAALDLPVSDLPPADKEKRPIPEDGGLAPGLNRPAVSESGLSETRGEPGLQPPDPCKPALLHACATVYLADKFHYGERTVSLAERFAVARDRFAGMEEAVSHRERIARLVRDRLFAVAGEEPETILLRPCGHALEEFLLHCLEESAA